MTDDAKINVFIGPLTFPYLDLLLGGQEDLESSPENILRDFCTPGIDSDIGALIQRYAEIKTADNLEGKLFAAPGTPEILNKMIWPIRHARISYMLGNYLGTISLCGVAAEMLALFLFSVGNDRTDALKLTDATQKALFGSTFENLGQQRRVSILREVHLIDNSAKELFDEIRNKRRLYLHLLSHEHDALSDDAVMCYQAAMKIAVFVFPQEIHGEKLMMRPRLLKYLKSK